MRPFRRILGAERAGDVRKFETTDLARRLGAVPPERIRLRELSRAPAAAFNPSLAIKGGTARVFARVLTGYCMYAYERGYMGYASAIAEFKVPLDEVLSAKVGRREYDGRLAIWPSTEHDAWGAEDPRVCEIDGELWMVYVGRTVRYFEVEVGRSVPIAAVERGSMWEKVCAFALPRKVMEGVVEDRDAFLLRTRDGKIHLFHRPRLVNGTYCLVISQIPEKFEAGKKIREFEVAKTSVAMEPAEFEERIGWACPPVQVGGDSYLVLVHGVDRALKRYRVFATLLDYSEDVGFSVSAVSPRYVMEPKEPYEVFGDRPYVVFPCGAWRMGRKLLISYGAADSAVAFAEFDVDELLSVMEAGRIS